MPSAAHSCSMISPQRAGQLLGRGRRVGAGVGDAEAAAEVELGQGRFRSARRSRRAAAASAGRPPRTPRRRRSASRCGSGCRPGRAPGCSWQASSASAAGPPAIENPNFWSSWAVAMYSWVCASTPVVARTSTRGRTPSSSASAPSRAISAKESTMIRPTPAVRRLAELGDALVVAVQADPAQVHPGPLHHRQLAAGADVDAQTLLGHPAGHRGAEEGLGRVVDVPAGERARRRPGPGPAGPASSTTYAGVPTWSAISVTLSPATVSTPSLVLARPRRSRAGQQRVDVGGKAKPAGSAGGDVGVDRAGDVGVGHAVTVPGPGSARRLFSSAGQPTRPTGAAANHQGQPHQGEQDERPARPAPGR